VGEGAVECQLVLPPPLDGARAPVVPGTALHPAPLRIVELDPDPLVDATSGTAAPSSLGVVVGPGGDEGEVLGVDLLRTGGLLVVGPPGSGRTSTLDAIVGDLIAAGVPVLRLGSRLTGSARTADEHQADLADPAAAADWLERRRRAPAVVCVDDLGPAGSAPALAALPHLGVGGGVALLATATAADLSTWFQGPVGALRRARSGLLLCPGPGDADLLSVRLPRTPLPVRPGSGWLVRAGAPVRVQVARHRARTEAATATATAQSSSSTGPISCVAYQASS
jgi:S-DNA-T family DNA segregation ATPase FtsK/SpoIIIE